MIETDPEGSAIAWDHGAPVAYATSYRRDDYWFLSFLFVHPDSQGAGVGRALLTHLAPSDERVTHALVIESFQPVSLGLYASLGITPRSIRTALEGVRSVERLPDMGSLEVRDGSPDDIPAMSALDRHVLGFERPDDHAWWQTMGTVRTAHRGGDMVGYVYRDEGGVGPIAATDQDVQCRIVADVLRSSDDPAKVVIPVYGESAEVFSMLVNAGARTDDRYRYLYCSDKGPLPASYLHYAGYMP
jgi:GNAT superfamily N-acetyltransferase